MHGLAWQTRFRQKSHRLRQPGIHAALFDEPVTLRSRTGRSPLAPLHGPETGTVESYCTERVSIASVRLS